MDPSNLTLRNQERDKSQNASEQPAEYANIVGVMKPKEKGKKKK